MHECCWLKRLVGRLVTHHIGGEAAQFSIDHGQKLLCSRWIAALDAFEDLSDVVHRSRDIPIVRTASASSTRVADGARAQMDAELLASKGNRHLSSRDGKPSPA